MFVKTEVQQENSPGLEDRLRLTYYSRNEELERIGFRYLCCYSESFSVALLLSPFQALIVLSMLLHRETIRLRGARIYYYFRLLISKDNATYAHAFGLGVKFYTAFSDGTFLVSANFAGVDIEQAHMTKRYRKAGISEVWADHLRAIRTCEAAGKHTIGQASFPTFANMSLQEG